MEPKIKFKILGILILCFGILIVGQAGMNALNNVLNITANFSPDYNSNQDFQIPSIWDLIGIQTVFLAAIGGTFAVLGFFLYYWIDLKNLYSILLRKKSDSEIFRDEMRKRYLED